MNFYIAIFIVTELFLLAMALHVINYSGFTSEQKGWFLATFFSVMLCAAAEFFVHGIEYKEGMKVFLTILTVLQFSFAPLLAVFFLGALGMTKHQKGIAIIFFAVNFLVETVAAPFKLIFYFDAEGYHRAGLFVIYTIFYIISLVYLIIGIAIVGKRFKRRDMSTIIMILVILVAGIIPMSFFKINITYTAVALSASLCYIYYNDLVQQDTKEELLEKQEKISDMQEHIIGGLASIIEDRDMDTGGHIARTSYYVKTLAEAARRDGVYADRIDDHFISLIYTLAPMHDIGKIMIPDRILNKPGKLTEEEFELMKTHATVGGTVVRQVLSGITDEEYLSFASDIATYHHEKWNGKGYPNGLKGEEIPLCARIMAIADVFDALVSERCYKKPFPYDVAFDIIEKDAGEHFDPYLAKVFLKHRPEFEINNN